MDGGRRAGMVGVVEAGAGATDRGAMEGADARSGPVSCGSEGVRAAECVTFDHSYEQRPEINARAGGHGASP